MIKQHADTLIAYGLTSQSIEQGKQLQEEANRRNLMALLGLQDQRATIAMRNQILGYVVVLSGEARVAGINALFRSPLDRRHFEKISLRNAVRKTQARTTREEPAEESSPEIPKAA